MMRCTSLNAEIVRYEQLELARRARRSAPSADTPRAGRGASPADNHEAVTIRLATFDDGRALELLADLDSASVPATPRLIAERGGRPIAALSLADGAVIADPFRPTSDIIALLALRASQMAGDRSPRLRHRLARLRARARRVARLAPAR